MPHYSSPQVVSVIKIRTLYYICSNSYDWKKVLNRHLFTDDMICVHLFIHSKPQILVQKNVKI